MSKWSFARRGDENESSWALRLLTDPLLGVEPILTIAEMSGCPRQTLEDTQRWLDQTDPIRDTVKRMQREYELSGTDFEIVMAALAAYELELTHSDKAACPMCGEKPRRKRAAT